MFTRAEDGWHRVLRFFPSPPAGEGGSNERSSFETGEGFLVDRRKAPPHPAAFGCHLLPQGEKGRKLARRSRQNAFLDRLDLQREIFRVDAALREAAGDEPEAILAGARIHVAQLLPVAKTPDWTGARGDLLAEQLLHQNFLRLV